MEDLALIYRITDLPALYPFVWQVADAINKEFDLDFPHRWAGDQKVHNRALRQLRRLLELELEQQTL